MDDDQQLPLEDNQNQEEQEEVQEEQSERPDKVEDSAEQQEEEEQEISNDPVEEEQPEERPPSRREQKRIDQLLDKLSKYEQSRAEGRISGRREPSPRNPKQDQIIPEGEYDLDQINGMAESYGKKLYEEGLSQAQQYHNASTFATRLEIDAPKISSKYEFLNDESEQFNPGVADLVNRMYLNTVGYDAKTGSVQNLDLRYGEFVEGFMDAVQLIAADKAADSTKNVARQAAQTGLRPGGVTKPKYQGDDPRKMTDEQLDAMIAQGLGIQK